MPGNMVHGRTDRKNIRSEVVKPFALGLKLGAKSDKSRPKGFCAAERAPLGLQALVHAGCIKPAAAAPN